MNLERVVNDVADALKTIDTAGVPFKDFHAGAGPYGEPQLVKLIAEELNGLRTTRRVSKRGRLLIF